MPKKQALTVAALKSLILTRFNMEQSRQAKLQTRFQQELGSTVVQEEKPELIVIKNKFADLISGVLARRLRRNRRTTPLFSSRDFTRLVPSMISEIAKVEGNEFNAESRKMFENVMKVMFKGIFKIAHAMVPPRKNHYEEYWRWITIVFDLAAEHGILPTEFLALEGAADEITRRMFTKKQFVALSKRAMSRLMDVDSLKKTIIQPMLLAMLAEGDEEERRELEQEFEAELMPQLREIAEKSNVVINAWINEEVGRIYAVA